MSACRLYPLFADLAGRAVIVVGGGVVAQRKAAALLESGAAVTVAAPAVNATLQGWADAGRIRIHRRAFEPAMLDDQWLVVAATDETATNRAVKQAADEKRILANVVDDAALSSFQVPAVIDRAPLVVAVSSGGAAPILARRVRERIEALLEPSVGALAALLGRLRGAIRARLPDLVARRRFQEQLLDGDAARLVRDGRVADAESTVLRDLARVGPPASTGSVVLVGAGPGDPGLLTLRGLRALNEADVVLHDRLVSADVLALARRDAECIEVGKEAGNHHVTQDRIHALLLAHAQAGRRVVRLKGGDPGIFGRGGEEMEFLRNHEIPFEVVPGVTAALACAAYAGIPLTHREYAQSVRFVTAHTKDTYDTLDWRALALERQTVAFYMGVAGLEHVAAQLIAHGRNASTPFALVENGTRANQRVVLGTLADLPRRAQEENVRSPALLILGEVAAFAQHLHWYGAPPLVAAAPALARAA